MSSTLEIVLFCLIISLGVNYYMYRDNYIKNETYESIVLKNIMHKEIEKIVKEVISNKFNISEDNIKVEIILEKYPDMLTISNMSDNDINNLQNDKLFNINDCLLFTTLTDNNINDHHILCTNTSIFTDILNYYYNYYNLKNNSN
jgi:hypothetical protein